MISINNLKKLQDKQKVLDEYILNLNQTSRSKTLEKRELAFIVELCEFANEHRDFKYWSQKRSSSKAILIDEYVDALHFLISLSIDLNIKFENLSKTSVCKQNKNFDSLTSLLIWLIQVFSKFITNKNEITFFETVFMFLKIADFLNYSEEEILKGYEKKHQINYERQKSNY